MRKFLTIPLILALAFLPVLSVYAQTGTSTFDKVEILLNKNDKINEKSVRMLFLEDELRIVSKANGEVLKTFNYKEIKGAEYSYSKNPRWKTGLGLGAASIIFPPLLLIALPIGFSKHRRHWLTIQTENDYVLLKLSKSNRKFIIPTLEVKSGVQVKGRGDDK